MSAMPVGGTKSTAVKSHAANHLIGATGRLTLEERS